MEHTEMGYGQKGGKGARLEAQRWRGTVRNAGAWSEIGGHSQIWRDTIREEDAQLEMGGGSNKRGTVINVGAWREMKGTARKRMLRVYRQTFFCLNFPPSCFQFDRRLSLAQFWSGLPPSLQKLGVHLTLYAANRGLRIRLGIYLALM